MDWIVTVSPEETAAAKLAPETQSAAQQAFEENGSLLLRGAFPVAVIDAMQREYVSQFGALDLTAMRAEAAKPAPNRFVEVGPSRYDFPVQMTGAFGTPDAFANSILINVLRPLLGEDLRLINFTLVVAHPGAPMQRGHRDLGHLFAQSDVGPNLPVYAVNVAVPLIDVDIGTGPTGVWLGSHRSAQSAVDLKAMTACSWRRGDCVLMDYRTIHAGLPNLSGQPRPVAYMVYARPWFFDGANHVDRLSLDMPLDHYEELPESARRLATLAYSYQMRGRWAAGGPPQWGAGGASKVLPMRGKLGRNDPCHCGSGKKFKQCHGRGA